MKAETEILSVEPENGVMVTVEKFISDIEGINLPTPTFTVNEEEVTLFWERYNKNVVIGRGEGDEFRILLPELFSGSLLPLTPPQLEELNNWIHKTPVLYHRNKKPEPSKENIMNMMDNMFKAFGLEEMFDKMEGPDPPVEEPPAPLDSIGVFLLTLFLSFLQMLSWMLSFLHSNVRLRGAIKGLILDTIRDVQEGYWNDVFRSPGRWMEDFSPRLYRPIALLFRGANCSIRNKVITMSMIMFMVGYRYGSC
jgi:hypothetical protein